MKAFLKENFVLVLGISLPLILVIAVIALQSIIRSSVEPPQYGIVFAEPETYYMQPWAFEVKNKKLVITYQEDNRPDHYIDVSVWLQHYDPVSGKMERVRINKPDNYNEGEEVTITVPQHFADLSLSDKNKSPDGYTFSRASHSSSSIFTDIFGYNSRKRDYRLHKNGVSFNLPDRGHKYRYENAVFIGWVEHE